MFSVQTEWESQIGQQITPSYSMPQNEMNVWVRRKTLPLEKRGDIYPYSSLHELEFFISRRRESPWDLGLGALQTWTVHRKTSLTTEVKISPTAYFIPQISLQETLSYPLEGIGFLGSSQIGFFKGYTSYSLLFKQGFQKYWDHYLTSYSAFVTYDSGLGISFSNNVIHSWYITDDHKVEVSYAFGEEEKQPFQELTCLAQYAFTDHFFVLGHYIAKNLKYSFNHFVQIGFRYAL